jgi:hypothetical protein
LENKDARARYGILKGQNAGPRKRAGRGERPANAGIT